MSYSFGAFGELLSCILNLLRFLIVHSFYNGFVDD